MDKQLRTIPFYDMADIDRFFVSLYQEAALHAGFNVQERIHFFSHRFLGRPYLLGALGEGVYGRHDQSPLYRYDVFDCISYVNTVLALAIARDFFSFQKLMAELSYSEKEISYLNRHHFMSVDWNVHNQRLGYIKDITQDILDEHEPIVVANQCEIHRPNWFRHRSFEDIKQLQPINKNIASELVAELHSHADKVSVVSGSVEYLPLTTLFDAQGHPREHIFEQIPNSSIIEIVRPNWDLRPFIGTFLQISHIGFALRKNGQLLFRHASSILKRVLDIPLHEYLHERLTSPSIKGINIQQVKIDSIER